MIPSWIEILGFVTGAACVWLLVKENVWNWPAEWRRRLSESNGFPGANAGRSEAATAL